MWFVRSLVLMLVMVMALVVAGCGSSATQAPSSNSGSGSARTFNVTATDFKYDPAESTFKAGEKVKVNLTNKGAVDHTWVLVDSGGKELVKVEAKVGQTASKEFTAPAAGTYQVICDIPGHKEAGMVGKATIQ